MIRLKFSNALSNHPSTGLLRIFLIGLVLFATVSVIWAAPVTPESALRVAMGQVQHHLTIFGHWNGATSLDIGDPEVIPLEEGRRAYHFRILPTGYVIVAANDNLSPTPFYSTRSIFDAKRADNPNAMEAWILSRLNAKARAAAEAHQIRKAASSTTHHNGTRSSRVGEAWRYFDRLGIDDDEQAISRSFTPSAVDDSGESDNGDWIAPLLTTQWGQGTPYNIEMPDNDCISGHTLTGCVATAWAQVLKYWQWPPQGMAGQGSHSYTWQPSNQVGMTLQVDLTDPAFFDWANMPGDLNAPRVTPAQEEAVSRLIYALAVTAEMEFQCPESLKGSGSSRWAYEVLDTFFRFKPLDASNLLSRHDYTSSEWLSIIRNELKADPPRPVIFSMDSQMGWHEVVIDGYQAGVTDKVHVNFGWEGNHDAYFDITDDDDFNAGGFDWTVKENQMMVIGIEPDNAPPVIQTEDRVAFKRSRVTLSVDGHDPEDVGVTRYLWTQIDGPKVHLADAESPTPSFTVPIMGFDPFKRALVFEVKVYDANRAFSTDTCTVSLPGKASDGGDSGCFLGLLYP